jgi:hypothetical protein
MKKSTPKLLAAITASGAVLCLNIPAQAHLSSHQDEPSIESESRPLSLQVEQLQEKLRSSAPDPGEESGASRIKNIVQFFNFFNCFRPGWRNC